MISRSALDALTMVDELKKLGVSLHLIDLGGDIAGNGLGKLFLAIAAAAMQVNGFDVTHVTVSRILKRQGVG